MLFIGILLKMVMQKSILYACILLALVQFSQNALSQSDSLHHRDKISLELLQIKESQNGGHVFTGSQLQYAHEWTWESSETVSTLKSQIGAGAVFSRGILGVNFHLMPAEWLYKWNVAPSLFIGTVLAADYNYQLYPELQSGVSYWFSQFSAGLAAEYRFQALENNWRVMGTTSLLGLTSRPPEVRSPYFFDLGFGEALRYLHQNIGFGSVNQFSRTRFEVQWQANNTGNNEPIRLSYTFDIDAYFYLPQWIALRHGLTLTF